MEKIEIVDKDEIAGKGKEIYELIKGELEKEHKGEIVAIDINSGDYFIGKTVAEADSKASEKYPNNVFYVAKIGYPVVYVHR
jgi:hypothetical protein